MSIRVAVVDDPIAVVVDAIAVLFGVRVDGRIGVVAVPTDLNVAGWLLACRYGSGQTDDMRPLVDMLLVDMAPMVGGMK